MLNDLPIQEWRPSRTEHNDEVVILQSDNQVCEYEIRQACVYTLTSRVQWLAMDVDERAMIVAHYRIEHLIKLFYAIKARAASSSFQPVG